MELFQVKSILHQSDVGELLTDGMGCSEPILSKEDGELIDNFFVYLANKKNLTISGPIARIGLNADRAMLLHLTPCEETPFSVGPKDTIQITYPTYSAQDYENYAHLYSQIRRIAFSSGCTAAEKKIVAEYLTAWKRITAPEITKLYEELSPSFFEWAWRESL